jgi:hypothetical protein
MNFSFILIDNASNHDQVAGNQKTAIAEECFQLYIIKEENFPTITNHCDPTHVPQKNFPIAPHFYPILCFGASLVFFFFF